MEGTGPAATVPPGQVVIPQAPAPVAITVARTFTVTGQALGRGRVFTAATARLVFLSSGMPVPPAEVGGQRLIVVNDTAVTGNTYSLTANLDNFPTVDFNQGLWTVEVEGADNGVSQAFAAPFMPPTTSGATVSGVNPTGATTIAVALLNDLVDDPNFVLTADFQTAITEAIQAGQTFLPSLPATAFNAATIATVLNTVEALLAPLVDAAVDQIAVTVDGSPVPPTFPLFLTGSVIFEAQALKNGQPVAIPIEWSIVPADGGNVLQAIAFGGDSLWARGLNLGTVSVTARVAGDSRSTTFNVEVRPVPHPGHTQGTATGG